MKASADAMTHGSCGTASSLRASATIDPVTMERTATGCILLVAGLFHDCRLFLHQC
jgi:hypothetical protein